MVFEANKNERANNLDDILKPFDPNNQDDVNILTQMESDPAKIFWFESVRNHSFDFRPAGTPESDRSIKFFPDPHGDRGGPFGDPPFVYTPPTHDEIIAMMNGVDRNGQPHELIAIRGNPTIVTEEEVQRVQGYIRIFPDIPNRIDQLAKIGIIPDRDAKVHVIEYAKRRDAASGQMGIAVNKAVQDFQKNHPHVFLVAYVIDRSDGDRKYLENQASMAILLKTGFERSTVGVSYDDIAEKPDILFYLHPKTD